MSQNDVDYFTKRAQQHRDRAANCADPSARRLHDQFAASYAARVSQLAERETA